MHVCVCVCRFVFVCVCVYIITFIASRGLPPYRGVEVCVPRYDPQSYAGVSLSSWQGHPIHKGQGQGSDRVAHWSLKLGNVRNVGLHSI
jgi:hypothetical protein